MIPWLILNHVGDDVIKRNYEIKENEWKMESHTFGLRKEGRKLPLFDPNGQCSKKEERNAKRKEKMGRNEREKEREMMGKRNKKRKRKKRKKEGIKQRKRKRGGEERKNIQ